MEKAGQGRSRYEWFVASKKTEVQGPPEGGRREQADPSGPLSVSSVTLCGGTGFLAARQEGRSVQRVRLYVEADSRVCRARREGQRALDALRSEGHRPLGRCAVPTESSVVISAEY